MTHIFEPSLTTIRIDYRCLSLYDSLIKAFYSLNTNELVKHKRKFVMPYNLQLFNKALLTITNMLSMVNVIYYPLGYVASIDVKLQVALGTLKIKATVVKAAGCRFIHSGKSYFVSTTVNYVSPEQSPGQSQRKRERERKRGLMDLLG